jgi:hypothetical protein
VPVVVAIIATMRCILTISLLLAPFAGLAAAKPEKIRGVREPIYHLYLQAHPKDATMPVLGPEAAADTFDIGGTIQSTKTKMYLEIGSDSTSYKTLKFSNTSSTKAWGLEGDTIITTQGSSFGRRKCLPLPPMHLPMYI